MSAILKNGKTFLIVAYSLVVMATVLPGFGRIPGALAIPYYLVVPGYCLTALLNQGKRITELAFYSVLWSLTVVGAVFSVETLFQALSTLPLGAAVPALTLPVAAFDHYYR